MRFSDSFGEGGVLQYGGIGGGVSSNESQKMIFVPQQRSRINILGILVNIFCPWILFTVVLWVMGFKVHYLNPNAAWCVVLVAYGVATMTALTAYSRKVDDKDPSWYTYAAGAFFVGCTIAVVLGNYIFYTQIDRYYDYLTLNTYAAIDPARETGQMVMDAGRVYFASSVGLDIEKTAGFKHGDTYCVAPITHGQDKLQTYDFWAVGVNCCDNPRKFHCGADVDNYRARSGLRLMDEDQRPFFRLAVQQAESAYGLTAAHPVFFHWSQDPLKEIHMHMHNAIRLFIQGSLAVFLTNFCAVIWATFAFAKMGRVAS